MALKRGICQLCFRITDLAESHAIPKALIRDIQRRNSGKTYVIGGQPPYSQLSNDSGGDHLLCVPCESELNHPFDSYGVLWVNQTRQKIDTVPRSNQPEVDPQHMLGFLASVIWRAAISTNPVYDSLETDYGERMQLRRIFETPQDRYTLAPMSISNLIDKKQGFSQKALRDVVVPPTRWKAMSGENALRSFFFIANGMLFNLMMPRPSPGTGTSTFWSAATIRPRIRDIDIRTFPPIKWLLGLPIKRKEPRTRG